MEGNRRGELPVNIRIRLAQGGAMLWEPSTGAPVTPGTNRHSVSTVTSAVIVDVSGEQIVDHEAEMPGCARQKK